MPIATTDKGNRSEHMWNALKAHILRERQRKKQEREAEVEEERKARERKEREAREQQEDVMSLGETRNQISQLESKLAQLKDEKHQLFLQLKKVLNEDDNRRRQLVKENNDMLTIQAIPTAGMPVHPQLFLPQNLQRSAPTLQQGFKTAVKRPRSPSPQPTVPVSLYHQSYGYKPPVVANTSYQPPSQKDDGRRHELVRAVLWNKTPQYTNPPSGYYPVPSPQEVVPIYYPMSIPKDQGGGYETSRGPPGPPPPGAAYHMAAEQQKHVADHYNSLRQQPPPSRVTLGHGSIPMSVAPPPQQQQPPPKSGSITCGYPVRSSQTQQYQQAPAPASALYTASSRPLYQSPGTPMGSYPQRE